MFRRPRFKSWLDLKFSLNLQWKKKKNHVCLETWHCSPIRLGKSTLWVTPGEKPRYLLLVSLPFCFLLSLAPFSLPPSFQLVRESREALQQAIEVRKFYNEKIEVVARGDPAKLEQVEGDIAPFEEDLRSVLEVRGNERGRK